MSDIRRPLRSGLTALALCAATSAFAGVEIGGGIGETVGGGAADDNDTLIVDFEAGYRFENNLGLHAVYLLETNVHDYCPLFCGDSAHFHDFYGVKGVGYVPLGQRFELTGGLGFGQTNLVRPDGQQHENEALLSGGVQWRATQAFRMVLEYDYLTTTRLQMLTARVHWEF